MGSLSRGLEAWLAADSSLALGDRLPAVCPGTLRELAEWLRGDHSTRTVLPGDRAASLARSFVLEFLKQEGWLDLTTRERRHEVFLLLEAFFTEAVDRPVGRNDTWSGV